MTLPVPICERFHDSVDLLGLSRQADIHQQFSQGHIQRIMPEVELRNICTQGLRMEFVSSTCQ